MNAPLSLTGLNGWLDEIQSEHRQATRDIQKDWDNYLKQFRGEQWDPRMPKHRILFTANLIALAIKRKTALMTDTKPSIDIRARAHGLEAVAADVVTPALRANWDEQSYDQKFASHVLPLSMIFGACPVNVCYDRLLDGGRGDITIEVIDPRSLILDPAITRAVDMDRAEYAGFKTVMSLSQIRRLFPDRGHLVRPDSSVSRLLGKEGENRSGWLSPAHPTLSSTGQPNALRSFAVPRAVVEEIWVKDERRVGELPVELQQQAFTNGLTRDDLAWDGGRRIIRAGGNKVIIADGPNPYIDRKFPFEMLDWDIEPEHPWGSSEVKTVMSIQAILNKIGSQIVENAIKMNNNIWIGDRDALERHEWNRLNDAPGLLVKVKPGRTLRRESPPALPGSTFQMLMWLVQMIDTLTGLVDVTQGKRPIGVVSSSALEALNLSAQTLIRLQTRKFENFMERVGQKLIARLFQYYTADRVMHMLGPGGKIQEFYLERSKLLSGRPVTKRDEKGRPIEDRQFDIYADIRDLMFMITPGSSMAITRIQKGMLSAQLYAAHLLPGVEVLKSVEWQNPEDTIQAARAEMAAGVNPQDTKNLRVPK